MRARTAQIRGLVGCILLASPTSNRAARRRRRRFADRVSDILETAVERHAAVVSAVLINVLAVALLCLYKVRERPALERLPLSVGSLLAEPGNGEEAGEEDASIEPKFSEAKVEAEVKSQPALAELIAPKLEAGFSLIETTAVSQFFYKGVRHLPGGWSSGGGEGSGGGGGKMIGKLGINAQRLGVILDVSGSMADDSEKVSRIIAAEFENAICLQVNGCDLMLASDPDVPYDFGKPLQNWTTESAWPAPKPKGKSKEWPWARNNAPVQTAQPAVQTDSGTIVALQNLAERGVDAVYWFCDLQDVQMNEALREMDNIVRTYHIRLYVQSQDLEPGMALKEIIRRSGGAYSVEF